MRIAMILAMALLASHAAAQEHDHSQVDWYDPLCCSNRDCKPVDDADIEFDMIGGVSVIRYKPTGAIFYQPQWKTSQDERYHVCLNVANGNALCVYIRAGV